MCGEALIDVVVKDGATTRSPGGGPYNTARALARLGVPTAFLGRLSTDEDGQMLANRLRTDGASLALASFGPEPTTSAIARIGPDGKAAYEFLVEGSAAPNLTAQMLPAELPRDVVAIHVGTLGLVMQPIAATLTELVQRAGERTLLMLDPNIRPALIQDAGYRDRLEWLIERSTIVKASAEDLAWLYPGIDYRAAARRMLEAGVALALITLGPLGAYGATRRGDVIVPAVPIEVVDTIGAGDAFGAASLAWLYDREILDRSLVLSTDELRSLLEFACLVAALTATRSGAEPPTRGELDHWAITQK